MSNLQLEAFARAYKACALWSSTDDNGEPIDTNYDAEDLDRATSKAMDDDCASFYLSNEAEIQCDGAPMVDDDVDSESERKAAMAGHDFWLTRNGHGAGFGDGDWPDGVGQRLEKACKGYRTVSLYVGPDNLIRME